jgi:hypothetical protein
MKDFWLLTIAVLSIGVTAAQAGQLNSPKQNPPPLPAGRVVHGDMSVRKYVDKSSAKLMRTTGKPNIRHTPPCNACAAE